MFIFFIVLTHSIFALITQSSFSFVTTSQSRQDNLCNDQLTNEVVDCSEAEVHIPNIKNCQRMDMHSTIMCKKYIFKKTSSIN